MIHQQNKKGLIKGPFCFEAYVSQLLVGGFRSRLNCGRPGFPGPGFPGRRPVVEVMSYLMAIAASRELCHDAGRMLLAVTIFAVRHHLVLFLMAECAAEGAVNCLRCREQLELFAVACRAVLGVGIGSVGDFRGHVHFMAFIAVGRGYSGGMGFVALSASRLLAMNIMAGAAAQGRMLALVFRKLFILVCMAGQAGSGQLRRKRDFQRCVRVLMAVQAAGCLKMRLALMATVALRNVVFRRWTMSGMTILAGNFGLVFSSVCFYLGRLVCVTLGAIAGAEPCWCCLCRRSGD